MERLDTPVNLEAEGAHPKQLHGTALSTPVHFAGLTGLRALAAMGVMVTHLELYRRRGARPSLYDLAFLSEAIGALGKHCVHFFFVLSGFLITYLLLFEKQSKGKIAIWQFYCRRMLRIWPVYYLILAAGFFLFPFLVQHVDILNNGSYYSTLFRNFTASGDYTATVLFFFMLPNIALLVRPPVAIASQSWSVGVEEQFYLLWPHLISRVKTSWLPWTMIAIVAVMNLLSSTARQLLAPPSKVFIVRFLEGFRVDLMAVGGFFAVLYFHQNVSLLRTIRWRAAPAVAAVSCFLVLAFSFDSKSRNLISSLAFSLVILLAAERKLGKAGVLLENTPLSYLGKLSYGIYMYHPMVMFLSYSTLDACGALELGWPFYIAASYAATFSGTILISHLSYQYFERKFLLFKNRISPAPSCS